MSGEVHRPIYEGFEIVYCLKKLTGIFGDAVIFCGFRHIELEKEDASLGDFGPDVIPPSRRKKPCLLWICTYSGDGNDTDLP